MTGTTATPLVPPLDAALLNGSAAAAPAAAAAPQAGQPPGKGLSAVPLTTPTSVLGGDGLSDSPVAGSPAPRPAAADSGGSPLGANGAPAGGSAAATTQPPAPASPGAQVGAPVAAAAAAPATPPISGIIHSVVPTARPSAGAGGGGGSTGAGGGSPGSVNSPRAAGSPRRSALVRLFSASPKAGGAASGAAAGVDGGAAEEEDEEDCEDDGTCLLPCEGGTVVQFCVCASCASCSFWRFPTCAVAVAVASDYMLTVLLWYCTASCGFSSCCGRGPAWLRRAAGMKKKKTLLHRLFHRLLKRPPLDVASAAPSAPPLSVSDSSSLMAQLLALPPTFTPASPLLPPAASHLASRPTLVLDLDETLVHSSFTYLADAHLTLPLTISGETAVAYVRKRPRVDEFLAAVADIFEVVVFTASLALYADPVLDELSASAAAIHGGNPADMIHGRLYREHCVMVGGVFVKNLTLLGRDIKQVIIVDNSPISYAMQPENAVHILDFIDDEADGELDKTLAKVMTMRDVPDVRNVIRPPPKQAGAAPADTAAGGGDKVMGRSTKPTLPPLAAMEATKGSRRGSLQPGGDVSAGGIAGVTPVAVSGGADSPVTPPGVEEGREGVVGIDADSPAGSGEPVAATAGLADDAGDAMAAVASGQPDATAAATAAGIKGKAGAAEALVPGTPVTPSGPFSDASTAMQT